MTSFVLPRINTAPRLTLGYQMLLLRHDVAHDSETERVPSLSTGGTETLVPAGEGIAFPLGTLDTFVTHGASANLIETVNTVGLPIYARQLARPDGSAIEVKTEASILPINKRPRLAVRIHSSN